MIPYCGSPDQNAVSSDKQFFEVEFRSCFNYQRGGFNATYEFRSKYIAYVIHFFNVFNDQDNIIGLNFCNWNNKEITDWKLKTSAIYFVNVKCILNYLKNRLKLQAIVDTMFFMTMITRKLLVWKRSFECFKKCYMLLIFPEDKSLEVQTQTPQPQQGGTTGMHKKEYSLYFVLTLLLTLLMSQSDYCESWYNTSNNTTIHSIYCCDRVNPGLALMCSCGHGDVQVMGLLWWSMGNIRDGNYSQPSCPWLVTFEQGWLIFHYIG